MTAIFVNNTDLMPPGWRFLEALWTGPRADWAFFHGVPQNTLERRVRRPHLARYRAAIQAVSHARAHQPRSILVSHLPAMAAATNLARRVRCPKVRQIAFAFNFTELPKDARLSYFRYALKGIEEFVIFSEAERAIYSDRFGISGERFRMLHWAMDTPVPSPDNPAVFDRPYLCAVGGEGRDYSLLAEAMRNLPEIRLAVVARPHSIEGVNFSDNVSVFTNLPGPQTWRLVCDSKGMVIPLKSAETACGHVTMVGAQLLNIPLAVTRSTGVADYVSDKTAFMIAPSSVPDTIEALRALDSGGEPARQRQREALRAAQDRSNLDHWVRYFESLLTDR